MRLRGERRHHRPVRHTTADGDVREGQGSVVPTRRRCVQAVAHTVATVPRMVRPPPKPLPVTFFLEDNTEFIFEDNRDNRDNRKVVIVVAVVVLKRLLSADIARGCMD